MCRDGKGRLPYVIAGSKETRQEFRRFMADFPDMYDYARSQVTFYLVTAVCLSVWLWLTSTTMMMMMMMILIVIIKKVKASQSLTAL